MANHTTAAERYNARMDRIFAKAEALKAERKTMATETLDKLANAKASAKATFEHIREMVEALRKAREDNENGLPDSLVYDAEHAIIESPLSVEVRSGWYTPSAKKADKEPVEYRILLSTGGPAVQIVGELDDYNEPESAELECQDWFQPWTRVSWQEFGYTFEELMKLEEENHPRTILLEYAQSFYFGE